MKLTVITLFPELYTPFLSTSLVARAREQGAVSIDAVNLFTYAARKERIDSPTFGHGAGMLLRPDIVEKAVEDRENVNGKAYKIFFSPQGEKLTADVLKALYEGAKKTNHVMLLPARYEGMDARVEEYYADSIISVGDFVLMGGDLPAMMLIEGLLRFVPGVIGKKESVEQDSFYGPFVDYPEYTAPVQWKGLAVPEVVRSGNHKEIALWREKIAAEKSTHRHFEWVRTHALNEHQERMVQSFIPAHYAILMHSQVMLPHETEGCTSVTSLDIHDIARSAMTYGLKGYFIVTPLEDQQKIVQKLLGFWASDVGADYNPHRHGALERVHVVNSLDEAMAIIHKQEDAEALLIGTSARTSEHNQHGQAISFYDQKKVWAAGRPVAFVFGTGRGLAQSVLLKCAFMLPPVRGFTPFNHLSVRSAAAIIFDRWLGNNVKNVNHSYNFA